MIKKAFKKLMKAKVNISRQQWIDEAMSAEKSKSLKCCEAIIKECLQVDIDVKELDSRDAGKKVREKCMEDANKCNEERAIYTAKMILRECLTLYPGKKKPWNQMIQLVTENEDDNAVNEVLKEAVQNANNNTILVLKHAKHIWKKLNDPTQAK